MTIAEVLKLLNMGTKGWGITIIVVLSLVQIAPVKLNPLSWIARTFGRAINKDLYDKVDELEESIQGVAKSQVEEKNAREEDNAIMARIRILRFNDELLMAGKEGSNYPRHSKESFDQTLDDITYYEDYCEDHKHFKNDKAAMAIKNVKRCYEKCCIDNDFL